MRTTHREDVVGETWCAACIVSESPGVHQRWFRPRLVLLDTSLSLSCASPPFVIGGARYAPPARRPPGVHVRVVVDGTGRPILVRRCCLVYAPSRKSWGSQLFRKAKFVSRRPLVQIGALPIVLMLLVCAVADGRVSSIVCGDCTIAPGGCSHASVSSARGTRPSTLE